MTDINNKVVGFVGDRDGDQELYPVLIQERKAWDLENVNVITDETAMTAYCANEANVGKLWALTNTKVKIQLPRMAVVPLALVPMSSMMNWYEKLSKVTQRGKPSAERIVRCSSSASWQRHIWRETILASCMYI